MRGLQNIIKLNFLLIVICISCKSEIKEPKLQTLDNSIEIRTENMEIQTVDTIASGWNTFKYKNLSHETHFIVFEKYPEGKNLKDSKTQIFPVFKKGMDLINIDKTDEGIEAFGSLPPWFFKVIFTGGIGLTSPNTTSESTIYLEPGNYLMECYVKMSNGQFHSVMGMYKEIIVTDSKSNTEKPKSTVNLSISYEDGIKADDAYTAGNQTIAVTFTDQKTHEHFLGHDIHLVKLNDEADLEELDSWMNWFNPKGLISPSPKGITFLGGIQEMPKNNTGYFKVNLKPGKYAFISEVPDPTKKNMLKQFIVK
ncbi:hypothetical protein WNY78_17690 [Psychroserpens sp. AS72]|uniref:hypothetical protein n=1 Tax=Psychroserpens sp. AS72 TaxID=3135775 RepID=UPI0031808B70